MVTLDVNGGTVDGKATEEVIATYDMAFVIPDAVYEGYTFDEWHSLTVLGLSAVVSERQLPMPF